MSTGKLNLDMPGMNIITGDTSSLAWLEVKKHIVYTNYNVIAHMFTNLKGYPQWNIN